jgi:hypothetical protein
MLAQCLILLTTSCKTNRKRKTGFRQGVTSTLTGFPEKGELRMSEIANARINTFGPSLKADFVPTTEEPIFVLTRSQLKSIIQEATAPILQEIEELRSRQDSDYERFTGDICDHGQRLKNLEKIEPQPLQKDRGEILRALLVANGGKMLAKDARQKMHLIKPRFSELLSSMKDDIEIRPYHLKKNQNVLVLK